MCRPYDRNPQYYYPARPFMVASHLNALILSPVVFAPDCADSFFLARLYFLPVALLHFTMMLFSYFGSVMQWKRWHKTVWIVSIPIVVALLAAIRAVVEEQNGCLDAHLTLQDVADRSGYNRSYVSTIIKEEFGGFFVYVNHLRLAHVEAYLQQHASATLQEAVLESGFNSRQAYYSVKKKIS